MNRSRSTTTNILPPELDFENTSFLMLKIGFLFVKLLMTARFWNNENIFVIIAFVSFSSVANKVQIHKEHCSITINKLHMLTLKLCVILLFFWWKTPFLPFSHCCKGKWIRRWSERNEESPRQPEGVSVTFRAFEVPAAQGSESGGPCWGAAAPAVEPSWSGRCWSWWRGALLPGEA